MVIEEADFRLTSEVSDYFWDLELLYTVRPKGKPERQEFKNAGYGMPLESCFQWFKVTKMKANHNRSSIG